MKRIQHWLPVTLLIILTVSWLAAPSSACYTVVVGKDASTQGCVIVGHNEDDAAPQVVNHHKIGRVKHPPGAKVKLLGGGEVDQVPETWAYFWEEMPGMLFSDSFLNEWGVCVTSDNCPSREDKPVLTDGGISKDLRFLIAQRATTAREGVALAAQLVERFGYDHPGRTYIIADPKEGWLFCAVNGKHWLAQRVPDDQVAMVANTYSIRQVDLKDTANVKASTDIVRYAKKRGWYNPKKEAFDFAAAYADPEVATDSSNVCRQWAGLNYLTTKPRSPHQELPFSLVPKGKLGVAEVTNILRDHYTGTDFYQPGQDANPHSGSIGTICNETTQTSFVAELRGDGSKVPVEMGLVYWVTLGPPCTSVYLPFHFGMEDFPSCYVTATESPTISNWQARVSTPFEADARQAYWTFSGFHHWVFEDYTNLRKPMGEFVRQFQNRAFIMRDNLEATWLRPNHAPGLTQPALFQAMVTNYNYGLYLQAIEGMREVLPEK